MVIRLDRTQKILHEFPSFQLQSAEFLKMFRGNGMNSSFLNKTHETMHAMAWKSIEVMHFFQIL